jgi:3-deoxy-D-arabino-heptulosonate 7-phosphate (DAHP) synthase
MMRMYTEKQRHKDGFRKLINLEMSNTLNVLLTVHHSIPVQ